MKAMIARKKRQFANRYKVIYGVKPFRYDMILKGDKKVSLTNNHNDPVYTINFNNTNYVIKQVLSNGEDEWEVIVDIITKNLKCPYMIDYYACIRSMINQKRFIMMRRGDTDLKDYLNDNEITIDREFIDKLLRFVFLFQLWCIKNLKLVYTDMKCRNILLLFNDKKDGVCNDFEFRMTDIGLMEESFSNYELDETMLNKDDITNFMYPRKECNYQQVALFVIVMLVIEVSTMNIKVPESEKSSSSSSSSPKSDDKKLLFFDKDESESEKSSTSEHIENSIEMDVSAETDDETDDESVCSFIELLDGRKTDDNLDLILANLPIFINNNNDDLLNFLIEIINFEYKTVKDAYNSYLQINKT